MAVVIIKKEGKRGDEEEGVEWLEIAREKEPKKKSKKEWERERERERERVTNVMTADGMDRMKRGVPSRNYCGDKCTDI